jgi:hypothetical protein
MPRPGGRGQPYTSELRRVVGVGANRPLKGKRTHRIQALQKIRDEFGGGIHDALDLLNRRHIRLRQDRPEDFTAGD